MRTVLTAGRFSFALAAATAADTPAELAPAPKPEEPPPALAPRGRKERRAAKTFNRRLEKRLQKDKTPVKLEVLPDGGLHATIDMRGEKKP